MLRIGLGYLHLDRTMMSLSCGEKQRVRLAASLDSSLTGMIYILDEPTLGLHPRDNEGIITVMKQLRDQGNTVIVIEHDKHVIQACDYLLEVGPGAGMLGGEILWKHDRSIEKSQIPVCSGLAATTWEATSYNIQYPDLWYPACQYA